MFACDSPYWLHNKVQYIHVHTSANEYETTHTTLALIYSVHLPHLYCSPNNLSSLSVCSISLPHSLHLNPVSGVGLEGGQSVGGVTVGRLGDIDGAILGGVGHSEGVALGVAGWPGDTQSGGCPACQGHGGEGHFQELKKSINQEANVTHMHKHTCTNTHHILYSHVVLSIASSKHTDVQMR